MTKTKGNNDRDNPRKVSRTKEWIVRGALSASALSNIPYLTRDTPEELEGGMSWQERTVDCVPKGETPTPDQIANALRDGKTSLPICPPTYQATESIGVSNGTCVRDDGSLSGFQGNCKEGEVEGVDLEEVKRPNYTVCQITRDGISRPCKDTPDYKPNEFYQLKSDGAKR